MENVIRIAKYQQIRNWTEHCACGCFRDATEYINCIPVVNLKHYQVYLNQSNPQPIETNLTQETLEQNRHLEGSGLIELTEQSTLNIPDNN